LADPRVAMVTGSRKGLGRHLATSFAERGMTVIGCSRGPFEGELPNYEHHCLDVSDEAAVRGLFKSVRKAHGRLDILVNNAGIASMNHAMLTPMATVDRVLSTNVGGTFLFCREAAKLMRKTGGRIVNLSTVAVRLDLEGEAIYAASKAAVNSLTRILARELAPFEITVNAVGPTPVETDLIRSVPRDKLQALLDRQAIHRFGTPDDVLNVVDFFIQPQSAFVTGQILYLGGV
jgi:3-oxoacyl-[acyl-carrier protein] reductase